MMRIVYILVGGEAPTGGHKMIVRHVEALTRMGFEAVAYVPPGDPEPRWFKHDAPIQTGGELRDTDILVIPEDAFGFLKQFAFSKHRKVVFCQNTFRAASGGIGRLTAEEIARYREFIACSNACAAWIGKYLPGSSVDMIPAFADERRFKPLTKQRVIACTPRKRQLESRNVIFMFSRLFESSARWKWSLVQSAAEDEVAAAFGGAAVFLSLSRLEGLPITTLEAMACGCVVAGFTGIGGREYATSANGFWVEEDDCESCALALASAVRLAEAGGPALRAMNSAAMKTASDWSHANFLRELESYWRRSIHS